VSTKRRVGPIEQFFSVEWRRKRKDSRWRLVATHPMYTERRFADQHAQFYRDEGYLARVITYLRKEEP